MQSFLFSFTAVFPVFALILLGFTLKRIGFINDEFISTSSRLVFRIALPILVFRNISQTDFRQIFNLSEILLTTGMTTLTAWLAWLFSGRFTRDPRERAPFSQGVFRSNIAIIATAIATNMYGPSGAAQAALHMCFLMPLFNILAVIVLSINLGKNTKGAWQRVFMKIITNPFIIIIFFAIPFSLFSIPIPKVLQGPINYTAQLTLPLALIGIGGSLSFKAIGKHTALVVLAAIGKLIVLPAAALFTALVLKLNIADPGILFILLGSPTAVSSFVMTKEMGGDEVLQANIIALTTFSAIFTLGLGLFVMRSFNLI